MPDFQHFASPAETARVVSLLFGVSMAVTFAEKLTLVRDFGRDGWFPWRIFRFDRTQLAIVKRWPAVFEALFGAAGMTAMFGMGLGSVALVFAAPVGGWGFTAGVAAIVTITLLLHLRSTYGGDGSQQMNLVIGSALLLGFNPLVKPAVGTVSLLFVAAQACLAYFSSGMAKVVSPIWMRGDPLVGIFATTAYGSPLGLRLVSIEPRLRRVLCLSMVAGEVLFPLAVIGPTPVLVFFLLWGAVFHLSNAVFMGLNTFLWSFLATYPAVVFAWGLLHR